MFDFQNLFGTVDIFTAYELPTFSHSSWFEARKAGHIGIKSIQPLWTSAPPRGAEYAYQVEFHTLSFSPAELNTFLEVLAERYAWEHDQVLESLEV